MRLSPKVFVVVLTILFVVSIIDPFNLLGRCGRTSVDRVAALENELTKLRESNRKFTQQSVLKQKPPSLPESSEGTGVSLTRDPRVRVTADTRGNLGPASVIVQVSCLLRHPLVAAL